MGQPVVHWEISTRNGAQAREFYGALFDWNATPMPGMETYAMVDPKGEGIGGGIMEHEHPYVTFYVQVDDLQECLDKAESMGGKTILGITPIPGHGSMAMLADPDGNMVGLWKE